MPEPRTYTGGCHCGEVRYEVATDLGTVISCNCSICRRKGHLLNFVPAEAFALKSGQDQLQDYQFNRHVIHHLFCRRCGIQSFARGRGPNGEEMVAVNVRCLDDVDLDSLTLTPFNGKDLR